jgi:hypothetical protein
MTVDSCTTLLYFYLNVMVSGVPQTKMDGIKNTPSYASVQPTTIHPPPVHPPIHHGSQGRISTWIIKTATADYYPQEI